MVSMYFLTIFTTEWIESLRENKKGEEQKKLKV